MITASNAGLEDSYRCASHSIITSVLSGSSLTAIQARAWELLATSRGVKTLIVPYDGHLTGFGSSKKVSYTRFIAAKLVMSFR